MELNSLEKIIGFFEKYPQIQYKKGDRILRPNEYSDHLYFVKKGHVKVYKLLQSGQEITLNCFNSEKRSYIIFGYSPLLLQFHVEALTDVTLYRAPKNDFQKFSHQNLDVKDYVLNDFKLFFEELINQVEWLSIPDSYTRIKAVLYSLAGGKEGNDPTHKEKPEIKATHQLIASFTGLSRETVTIQINKLISEGYLSRKNNALVIENLSGLAEDIR